jgi:regulator of nucleoside diphosphate kinase
LEIAMWKNQECTLTSKDFAILETMYDRRLALPDCVCQLLRHKLDNARVVFGEDVADNIVTLNSRVRYRVGELSAQTAIITQDPMAGIIGQSLPLTTARGLALLGLVESDGLTLPKQENGIPERILLEEVLFQPEAARRQRFKQQHTRRGLHLAYDAGSERDPQAYSDSGDNDPGPSAA